MFSLIFTTDLSSKNITTAKLASPTRIASPLEIACPGFTETEYEAEPIGFIKTVPFDFITLPMVSAKSIFEKIIKTNKTSIKKASDLISECILKDTIIHTFGTGHSHMVGLELFIRAGGLANVNAMLDSTTMTSEGAQRSAEIERIEGFSKVIWDQHKINKGDIIIIISNSGRNAMPIEMAMIAKKNKIPIIAITSMQQTKKYPSRHSSEKKLYEMADIVISPEDTENRRKPDPSGINLAMKKLNCSPENTLFFGDHFKDFEASKRAKTSFIFAEYGYHNNSIKDEDLNDVVKIKSLREILN